MSQKQKISIYGSVLIFFIVGIVFLIKGVSTWNISLLIIGSILIVLGLLRGILFKTLLKRHEDE